MFSSDEDQLVYVAGRGHRQGPGTGERSTAISNRFSLLWCVQTRMSVSSSSHGLARMYRKGQVLLKGYIYIYIYI